MLLCFPDELDFGSPSQRGIQHTQQVKHSGSFGVSVHENFMAPANAIFFLQQSWLNFAEQGEELLALVPSFLLFF